MNDKDMMTDVWRSYSAACTGSCLPAGRGRKADLVPKGAVPVGEFKARSGLIISDPCYPRGHKYSGELDYTVKGCWKGFVRFDGCGLAAELIAVGPRASKRGAWEYSFDICVDSGRAGVYERKHYDRDSECGFSHDGVESQTGIGDGCYAAYVHRNRRGQVDAVKIVFLAELGDDDAEEALDAPVPSVATPDLVL